MDNVRKRQGSAALLAFSILTSGLILIPSSTALLAVRNAYSANSATPGPFKNQDLYLANANTNQAVYEGSSTRITLDGSGGISGENINSNSSLNINNPANTSAPPVFRNAASSASAESKSTNISTGLMGLTPLANLAQGGVQFRGQVNVLTLKSAAPQILPTHPTVIPFHHQNATAFAIAKKKANLGLTKPRKPVLPTISSSSSLQPAMALAQSVSSTGFDGLSQSQSCACSPPDVQAAAGPNHVVEMVNQQGAGTGGEIFTKQGSSIIRFSLLSFFHILGSSDFVSDPKVIYDSLTGKWFASYDDFTAESVLVAVSLTNDPTGSWNVYSFAFPSVCGDQPIIGLSSDKFAISVNAFTPAAPSAAEGGGPCPKPTTFVGTEFYVVSKSDLIAGSFQVRYQVGVESDLSIFSVHPAHSLSSGSTLFMVSAGSEAGGSNSLKLYSITGSVPNAVLSTASIPIQMTTMVPDGLQPGTTATVNTGGVIMQDAAWYQGKLWLAFNDGCIPPGDTTERSCFQVVEIDTTTNTVLRDTIFGDNSKYDFYPALRIDTFGNLDLVFGFSSTTNYPSLAALSPFSTFNKGIVFKIGSAADTSTRYGDYFGAGLDPSSPSFVWLAGEYHSSSLWSTFIFPFTSLHRATLALNPIGSVPWGRTVTVAGKLTDSDASGTGISGKTITFTSPNGSPLPPTTTTKTDGTFSSTFTASNTVLSGWHLQAHFAGDANYIAADSVIQSYNTLKHTTSLTLAISPTSVKPGGTYSASGTLTDTTKSAGLVSKTITFSATSPIIISSKTTNSLGQYSATGLIAPSTTGTYSIQSHYAGDSLYNAANSPTQTLIVSTTAVAATPGLTTPTAGPTTRAPLLAPQVQPQLQQPSPQPSLPIANAGVTKTVLENTIVTLDGRASYSPTIGGKIIAYQWTQLPMGVPVMLVGANTATPTFTAPIVHTDTVLGFSLRVMDNHGAASNNQAIVYIMVKHNTTVGQPTSPNANQPQQQHPPQTIVPNNLQPIPS